jgi:hypothetical protein
MAACALFLCSPTHAETIVTWGAPAPDFSSEHVKHANSNIASIESREFRSFRVPAQGITVDEPFELDAIYIEVGDVVAFDTEFQIVLAPATYSSALGTLVANPSANLILDATIRTPLSTNDPGNNIWVRFDIDNITIPPNTNPYALFLTTASTNTVLMVKRSLGNYRELGQNRYFEQRDSNPALHAAANGTRDLRFALVAEPDSISLMFRQGLNGYASSSVALIAPNTATSLNAPMFTILNSDNRRGLLRFDNLFGSGPSRIPLNAEITSASVAMRRPSSGASGLNTLLFANLKPYVPSTVTYANYASPAVHPVAGTNYLAEADDGFQTNTNSNYVFEVTPSVQEWLKNPSSNLGWFVSNTSGSNHVNWEGITATIEESRPTLTVSYKEPLSEELAVNVVPESARDWWHDVTKAPYNADPSGQTDSTAAIQAAIDASYQQHLNDVRQRMIYVPAGTYRLSNRLSLRASLGDDNRARWVTFLGDGPDLTILKVDNNSPAFQGSARSVIQFLEGYRSNVAFFNEVRDLTIDVGSGNPGAIALQYHANNQGNVRNVTLRSSDPQGVGHTGLSLEKSLGGLAMIKGVTIEGFEIGVDVRDSVSAYAFEYLTLRGQRTAGLINRGKSVSIRGLTSENSVPAIRNIDRMGQVVLIDSTLRGGAVGMTAIDNQAGTLFVRNVEVQGYGLAINNRGQTLTGSYIEEFVSDEPVVLGAGPAVSRNLPIQDAPTVPVDGPEDIFFVTKNYVAAFIDEHPNTTTADAIQAAVDSGKSTILFDGHGYDLSKPVVIRGNVRRFHANWGWFRPSGNDMMKTGKSLFILENTNHPALLIEKIRHDFFGGSHWYIFQNNSDRTLILRDIGFAASSHVYRNEGTGDVFLEGVFTISREKVVNDRPAWHFKNQHVWARHFNPENDVNKEPGDSEATQLVVENGSFWCLGYKLGEFNRPYIHAKNGAQVEMLGGFVNSLGNGQAESRALFINESADLTIVGVERMFFSATTGPHKVAIREIKDGMVTELLHVDFPYRRESDGNPAIVVPLYRGVTY